MGSNLTMKYILLSEKKWHDSLFHNLHDRKNEEWLRVSSKSDFTLEFLNELKPDRIFIPHWSHIIPADIFENFECIVFHMTDLPYGRGGSPLQNLIVRDCKETKISALRVDKGLDTGDIYLKKELMLFGTAQEIFLRSSMIIFMMIDEIITKDILPKAQEGEIVEFRRRKPEEGDIIELKDIEKIYDYIRMLDAEGYPNAFIKVGNLRLEFSRATIKNSKTILADVRIIKE
jgi:methionyl-tRNA formyltransferase